MGKLYVKECIWRVLITKSVQATPDGAYRTRLINQKHAAGFLSLDLYDAEAVNK